MNILICYHSKLKDVINTQPGWTEEQLKRSSDAFLNVYKVFEQNHKFFDYTLALEWFNKHPDDTNV